MQDLNHNSPLLRSSGPRKDFCGSRIEPQTGVEPFAHAFLPYAQVTLSALSPYSIFDTINKLLLLPVYCIPSAIYCRLHTLYHIVYYILPMYCTLCVDMYIYIYIYIICTHYVQLIVYDIYILYVEYYILYAIYCILEVS